MKILVIIPAYNEQENLASVVRDLRENFSEADIIVVDDGSTDNTAEVAESLDVKVLRLPYNLGIGAAMQTGFRYALERKYDIAVQFDGDGQHIAAEIKKLLPTIRNGNADLTIGSRFLGVGDYKASLSRKVGIAVFARVLSCIIGTRLTDTTSGFRAANRKVIKYFAADYPDDYPEVEALVLLHKAGFSISETGVAMRQRGGGRSSINAVRSIYYMVKVLLAVVIDLIKKTR